MITIKKKILIVIIIIAVLVLGFCSYKVGNYYYQAQEVKTATSTLFEKAFPSGDAVNNDTDEDSKSYSFDCKAVQQENPDIVAWLYSEGTPINYPIVQSYDNNHYLRLSVSGKYNIAGSIFLDYRNSPDFTDFISIVYGHNMKNDSMFGTICNYSSQEYYEAHKSVDLYTTQRLCNVDIVGAFAVYNESELYQMTPYIEDHKAFIDYIKENSDIATDISFGIEDNFLVLSTCKNDFGDERYVVVGKIIK